MLYSVISQEHEERKKQAATATPVNRIHPMVESRSVRSYDVRQSYGITPVPGGPTADAHCPELQSTKMKY